MKKSFMFLCLTLIFAVGKVSAASFLEGWVHSEQDDRYLTSAEIKELVVGNTILYPESDNIAEYIDPDGRRYLEYRDDEAFSNGKWCIADNKLCFAEDGLKLICPKIKIKQDGTMLYSDEEDGIEFSVENSEVITISAGDPYQIKPAHKGRELDNSDECERVY